jgi:16S rRNA (guanine1207-N2)-methyltransferase
MRMGHYFINDDNLKSEVKEKEVTIKNKTYKFLTDSGVFSKKGLDFGTRCLLESLDLENISGNVLDFGCGYGPIGIFVKDNTLANVDMIDINNRSLKLAKENSELNNVSVNIFYSDIYSNVTNKYNYIISNPPIRVGKVKLYEILFGAKKHLTKDGELWIVVNKDQGAKSLAKDLEKQYLVTIVDKIKGFYIIKAQNH